MDFLEDLPEGAKSAPKGLPKDFQLPTIDKMLESLETFEGLSDADREKIRATLLEQKQAGNEYIQPPQMPRFSEPPPDEGGALSPDMIVLFSLAAIVFLIFVFFGYKLYKSLTEKQRRKEEKKRQKQHKKKK